jgi:hypothetical protein
VFAALFACGAVLIARSVAVVPALFLVAALFFVELVFVPFYARNGVGDWLIQGEVTLVSAVGLGSAVAAWVARRGGTVVLR